MTIEETEEKRTTDIRISDLDLNKTIHNPVWHEVKASRKTYEHLVVVCRRENIDSHLKNKGSFVESFKCLKLHRIATIQ